MYTPVNPNLTIHRWGVRGCTVQGHVFMMFEFNFHKTIREFALIACFQQNSFFFFLILQTNF